MWIEQRAYWNSCSNMKISYSWKGVFLVCLNVCSHLDADVCNNTKIIDFFHKGVVNVAYYSTA